MLNLKIDVSLSISEEGKKGKKPTCPRLTATVMGYDYYLDD
jgi:hypothetical protein